MRLPFTSTLACALTFRLGSVPLVVGVFAADGGAPGGGAANKLSSMAAGLAGLALTPFDWIFFTVDQVSIARHWIIQTIGNRHPQAEAISHFCLTCFAQI